MSAQWSQGVISGFPLGRNLGTRSIAIYRTRVSSHFQTPRRIELKIPRTVGYFWRTARRLEIHPVNLLNIKLKKNVNEDHLYKHRHCHDFFLKNLKICVLFRTLDTIIIASTMDPKPEKLQQNVTLKFKNLKVTTERTVCRKQNYWFIVSLRFAMHFIFKSWPGIFSGCWRQEIMYVLERLQRKKVRIKLRAFTLALLPDLP